jgi:hypothetical protein
MTSVPFDNLRLRMNIADMAQKFLALLMMTPRFRIPRFDVLEDRGSAGPLEVPFCHGNCLLDPGQSPRLPSNFINSADHWRLHFSVSRESDLRIQRSLNHSQDGLS